MLTQLSVLLALALALQGCGSASSTSLDITESLTVAMAGVFETPADATGNAEPKSLKFTVTGVTMTGADGTAVDLFAQEEAEATEYTIINRSQIVFEADLHDYVSTAFTAITVTFDPAITGKGKIEDELTATLTLPSAVYTDAFTVETGKAMSLDISVQWKDTVYRDDDAGTETMSSPSFVAALDKG